MIHLISIAEAFELFPALWIDTRSPKEYQEDHILQAINLPLLDDQERHEVGIIYKQISRDKAIEKGLEFFDQKIPTIYSAVKEHQHKKIMVYCARGGMRSGIIASLLDSLGFTVYKIDQGYKGFRNYMVYELEHFQLQPKVIILYGLTCSGKTSLLQQFPNSLDLEGLAQHRGSLMGALGLQPNSQKKFENLLLQRLRQLQQEKYILMEGESRRIGDVIMPAFLYKAMREGKKIRINRSLNHRAKSMAEEYFKSEHLEEIKSIVKSFNRVISNSIKQEIIAFIDHKNYLEAAELLLEHYYDPLYRHTLNQFQYELEINTDDEEKAVRQLKDILPAMAEKSI